MSSDDQHIGGPGERVRATVRPHHVLPDSGWVTAPLDGPGDAENVIELFRRSYERAERARRPRWVRRRLTHPARSRPPDLTSTLLEVVASKDPMKESRMTRSQSASERIIEVVASWPGVSVGPGDRGASIAFRVGRRELGHLHGSHAAHFSFPKDTWDELRREGRIVPHPVFPDARGPAAHRIESDADVDEVIELLRLNYERLRVREAAGAGLAETRG